MRAFITGSRAFGYATPTSDLDLVIYADESIKVQLTKLSESERTIKFGQLNLIVVTSEEEYSAFLLAKKRCLNYRVENKEESIAIHDKTRKEFDVYDGDVSGE